MIFVFDIDGTLCFDGQRIDPRILDALTKLQKNHKIVFASARPIRDLVPIIPGFEENLLIGGNGSIVSHNGHIRIMEGLTDEDFQFIKKIIAAESLDYVVDSQFHYSASITSENIITQQLDPLKMAKNVAIDCVTQAIKIILVNLSDAQMEDISMSLKAQESLKFIYHGNENAIDITARGVDKHSSLRKIIGNQAYIGFGNDANDREMLEHAQERYFVGNGNMDIKGEIHQLDKRAEAIVEALESLDQRFLPSINVKS